MSTRIESAEKTAEGRYHGSCLCGSVRYEVNGELGDFGYCHKAPWEPIEDTLPRFAEWAPKSVLEQRGSRQDLAVPATPKPSSGNGE